MQVISVDELINHKTLPYDIFNERGKVIFSAGEIMTPGKILQLKYIPAIYIESPEDDPDLIEETIDAVDEIEEIEEIEEIDEIDEELFSADENETIELDELEEINVPESDHLKEVNTIVISENVQIDIKDKYKGIMDSFIDEGSKDSSLCMEVRDTIIDEVIPEVNKILYKSQLKVYGDYHYAHGINVAMLSAVLAHKLKFNEQKIKDITLAAMLHDIGKTRIPESVLYKTTHTDSELKLIQLHPKLGYNIIKKELDLPEEIAIVALQHHEKRDGTGYPFRLSGDMISLETHIISICDLYDNLTSGKGDVRVKNAKEAIKYILEIGSKQFKSDVLYTFIHMTNYNDNTPVLTTDFER